MPDEDGDLTSEARASVISLSALLVLAIVADAAMRSSVWTDSSLGDPGGFVTFVDLVVLFSIPGTLIALAAAVVLGRRRTPDRQDASQ
jgi:hypothetical protein